MLQIDPPTDSLPSPVCFRTLRRGQHLYQPGDLPRYVYSVQCGALKTYRLSRDGTEWIDGFHFAGEVLGLDALLGRPASYGAVALETVKVSALAVSGLLENVSRSPAMRNQVLARFGDEISRLQERLYVDALGSQQRLASCLLWLVARLADQSDQPTIHLPMSHKEIANYLRLVPETMSRLFARFQERRWLTVRRRQVTLLNLAGLQRAALGDDQPAGVRFSAAEIAANRASALSASSTVSRVSAKPARTMT
jgi:CRP/FNR family transcriptional regulator